MKNLRILIIALFCLLFSPISFAQEMPLVYNLENTCVDCPDTYLPSVSELQRVSALTDPFEWSDGRGRIQYFSDWNYRRNEIFEEFQRYEVGNKPTRPDTIEASYSDGVLTVHVTENGQTLTLTSPIVIPEGDGPFPAIIGMGSPTGSLPSSIFTERDVAQITFNFGQVMAHTQSRGNEPINDLYPDQTNIGAYSAWPWGVSRLIDGLELVQDDLNINLERMGVTGCSFAGKMALFSGAFDERIALTIAIESGGGGYTSWRYSDTMQGVETLSATSNAWFKSDFISNFGNAVEKLPFDHHELMAIVAPRALFVTGNDGWQWLADESGTVASEAAQTVYDALGISDRFGYYNMGGHNHCALTPEKQNHIEAYVDKFLLGDETADTDVAATPYNPDLSPWITWENPTLTEGESYWDSPNLTFPENEITGMDTSVTFKWNVVENAQNYYFQLSSNSSFSNLTADKELSDTTLTINDLEKGVNYYWRVRAENSEGELGPWSSLFNFLTDAPLPGSPTGLRMNTHDRRNDFLYLSWETSENADNYYLEIADDPLFTEIVNSGFVSGTEKTIYGVDEGDHYYWRVQGRNIIGSGPWSEVADFTFILSPANLTIQSNDSESIELNWDENSDVEEGLIIERKEGISGSFSIIDTLAENTEEYTDSSFEGAVTDYTYRVRAFIGSESSNYSNEVTLAVTSIEHDFQVETPEEFELKQNFPNPFNPTTQIQFGLPLQSHVKLDVYNTSGQKVKELLNAPLSSGLHTITFNAENLASGIYIYRLITGNQILTNKMILMK
jgi:hypothetical protein